MFINTQNSEVVTMGPISMDVITMDVRVKKTYKSLLDAFEELLKENRYEYITISMLCAKAMVRRTTFYKHFDDKDSFFKFYMSQKRSELEDICGASTKNLDVGAYRVYMLDSLMTFLVDNETLVNNVMKSSQNNTLLESLADFMASDLKVMLQNQISQGSLMSEIDYEYLSAAMSGATIQTVKHWWSNGHKLKDRKKVVVANALLFPLKA